MPIAPGHEISGVVREVGSDVKNFKVGDSVGVGCMVESCRSCEQCRDGLEQHCDKMTQTYGSKYPEGLKTTSSTFKKAIGAQTNGGYGTDITVNEHFVFHLPKSMKPEYAGVLLCAGITMYSPLNRHIKQNGGGKGKKVGIVGFGGLGQMGVKLAKAMGADVTVFSRSNSKERQAKKLGADLLVHTDEDALKAATRKFDLVIDTVSADHPVASMLNTLKVGGKYVLIGAVTKPYEISPMPLLFGRLGLEGSLIGGIPETQEMLDFCSEHNIVPEYKVIHAKDATAHFKAMMEGSSDASRSVIDMSTLKDLL